MTTLTTERLQELRDRLKGTKGWGLTLYNWGHRVDADAERDIIAALSRLIEAEKELASAKETIATLQNQQYGSPCEQIRHAHEVEVLQAELAAIKAEVGPEPAMKAPEIDGLPHDKALHNALLALGEAGFAVIHYKHRAEHLAARNAELVAALKPFAALLQPHDDNFPDMQPVFQIYEAVITLGDLRKAQQEQQK